MARQEIKVSKTVTGGKVTWDYNNKEEQYGRILAGHAEGTGRELYEDSPDSIYAPGKFRKLDIFPTFQNTDTAQERADKIAARVEAIAQWLRDCARTDAEQTATAFSYLSEQTTSEYVDRAAEAALGEKNKKDEMPF